MRGFTIIEMLVAVAVFSFVISAASGVFIFALKSQRQGLAFQTMLDQVSYLEEYMSRAIRMAKKEKSAPNCLSNNGLNYEKTRAGQGLKFVNYQGYCQEFFFDAASGRLKEAKSGPTAVENFLTSASLTISSFNIKLAGENQTDDNQPKVTLFLKAQSKEGTIIKIQTTISQRNLDIRK